MEVADAETGEVLKLNTMTILEIDEEASRNIEADGDDPLRAVDQTAKARAKRGVDPIVHPAPAPIALEPKQAAEL